jgi:hypothetical protein
VRGLLSSGVLSAGIPLCDVVARSEYMLSSFVSSWTVTGSVDAIGILSKSVSLVTVGSVSSGEVVEDVRSVTVSIVAGATAVAVAALASKIATLSIET